jgi:hypothetical protein
MKYMVKVYGPFGPRKSAKTIILPFDTEKGRQEYLDKPKQLEVVLGIWEEPSNPEEIEKLKKAASATIEGSLNAAEMIYRSLETLREEAGLIQLTGEQVHKIGNAQQACEGIKLFLGKVDIK